MTAEHVYRPQPESWEMIGGDCCRASCRAWIVLSRDQIESYNRASRVLLCGKCEDDDHGSGQNTGWKE